MNPDTTFDGYTVYQATVRLEGRRTVQYQVRTTGGEEAAYVLALRAAKRDGAERASVLALEVSVPEAGPDWASRIRTLRYRLGESRTEFGRRLGVAKRTVEHWERGGQPPHASSQALLLELEAIANDA